MKSSYFDHESLDVYRLSIQFRVWTTQLIEESAHRRKSVIDQLERASTSIPLNIAEGNGKRSSRDRCRFLDIARGSALESAACLDVLVASSMLAPEHITAGKSTLIRIVAMLTQLIASLLAPNAEGPL